MRAFVALYRLAALVVFIVAVVATCILGIRMRRRIKRALGITVASEAELTSLNTWMKVEDQEEKNRGSKHPIGS